MAAGKLQQNDDYLHALQAKRRRGGGLSEKGCAACLCQVLVVCDMPRPADIVCYLISYYYTVVGTSLLSRLSLCLLSIHPPHGHTVAVAA
jgi:hypothetical protein